MKKLITLTICALIGMTAYGATVQRTILSHKGQLTTYDANHWKDAINDAVAGDTVYFTSGVFGDGTADDNLVIDKVVTLIGAGVAESDASFRDIAAYDGCATTGASTVLATNITIAIPGSPRLKSTLMEGFVVPSYYGFEPSVTISEPVTDLIIKRCQFGEYLRATAKVKGLVLEGCSVGRLVVDSNMENPDVHNCLVGNLYANAEGIEYTNCVFYGIEGAANCTFENCIMNSNRGNPDYCTYVNCLYLNWVSFGDHNSTEGCWAIDDVNLTESQLQSGGYIGTDGTVVGPLGGPAPFTLIPSHPYVELSSVTYSKSTKKLNVKVTVKKGK